MLNSNDPAINTAAAERIANEIKYLSNSLQKATAHEDLELCLNYLAKMETLIKILKWNKVHQNIAAESDKLVEVAFSLFDKTFIY